MPMQPLTGLFEALGNIFGGRTRRLLDNMELLNEDLIQQVHGLQDAVKENRGEISALRERVFALLLRNHDAEFRRCDRLDCAQRIPPLGSAVTTPTECALPPYGAHEGQPAAEASE